MLQILALPGWEARAGTAQDRAGPSDTTSQGGLGQAAVLSAGPQSSRLQYEAGRQHKSRAHPAGPLLCDLCKWPGATAYTAPFRPPPWPPPSTTKCGHLSAFSKAVGNIQ